MQAGREGLRATEQTTLLNAATAYVDVVRDQAVVKLRQTNVDVLTEQLRQTKDRFNVGEVTRTDVAQAEARRSNSITQLYAAQANLKTSRATYEVVIGHPPSNLVHPPSIVHLLPSQLEDAMTLGDGQNPFILAAVYQEEASLYNVAQIEGELLPEATLDVQYSQRFGLSNTLKEQQVFTVMGRVNVPLYQGGGVAARIRQAKETNNQLKKEVEDARLRIHAEVIANWAQLQATASEIQSAQDALEANRIALEGVREEEKVGQRTTLDVLNAELEYLGSQIQLVTAKRDRVVAEYALYGSVGRLDAQSLGLSVPYYDPLEHYNRVKNKWFGLRPRLSPPIVPSRSARRRGLPPSAFASPCCSPFRRARSAVFRRSPLSSLSSASAPPVPGAAAPRAPSPPPPFLQAVVKLRQTNVDVLTEQLRQTKDRFNVGEVTRTDVAQAEARRSDSITQLYAAQANLKTSRATYEVVIGHPPSNLVHPPSIVHLLPS